MTKTHPRMTKLFLHAPQTDAEAHRMRAAYTAPSKTLFNRPELAQ